MLYTYQEIKNEILTPSTAFLQILLSPYTVVYNPALAIIRPPVGYSANSLASENIRIYIDNILNDDFTYSELNTDSSFSVTAILGPSGVTVPTIAYLNMNKYPTVFDITLGRELIYSTTVVTDYTYNVDENTGIFTFHANRNGDLMLINLSYKGRNIRIDTTFNTALLGIPYIDGNTMILNIDTSLLSDISEIYLILRGTRDL